MGYFDNKKTNFYAASEWEALTDEKREKYYLKILNQWKNKLPFYEIEDSHTLTKKHGPFLLSITLVEGNFGYVPSFSIRALYSSVDIGKNSFVKFLQSPEYFARVDFFNDTFSGVIPYLEEESIFEEIFLTFIDQIPIAAKKVVTLYDINQWMEYCILGKRRAFLPQYMLNHIHALKYFDKDTIAEVKHGEYLDFIERHLFEHREGYLAGIPDEYQTPEFWMEQAEITPGEIQHRINEILTKDVYLEGKSLFDFPEYPIVDLEIPIQTEYISEDARYDWSLDHIEVVEVKEKIEWAEKYFLFNYFEKIEGKSYLRTMYRDHLEAMLEHFIQDEDYYFDLETDGHIVVRKFQDEFDLSFFHRDETNTFYKREFAIFQQKEYLELLRTGVNLYLATYFNLTTEKNKWYQLLDEASSKKMITLEVYH